jgi:O-antigen/teichoic acid export membrane protein
MGGRQSISFLVSIVLARKLAPADFGLMGIVLFFSNIAQSFVDSGFGPALVQRASITETDKSSVLVFNMAAGAAMTIALFLAAPLIARFYSEPALVTLTRAVSLNLFIWASAGVHSALLTRALDFRTQWKASMMSVLSSGTVAVWMAMHGYGVWTLAIQSLVSGAAMTLSLWVLSPWRPRAPWSIQSLRSFFPFSSQLLLDCLLTNVFDRLQVFVIGRVFSRAQLGYYMRADSTQQTPVHIMSVVCTRVAFPTFSAIADDRGRLLRGARAVLVNAMSVIMPTMIGLAFTARAVVLILFGEKWLPSVPYLSILSLTGIFFPLQLINGNILAALGRSDLVFRAGIIKRVLIIIAIALTFKLGLIAMIWGLFTVALAAYTVSAHYCRTLIGYGVRQQVTTLIPVLTASAAMSLALWPLTEASAGWPSAMTLAAQVFIGGSVYAIVTRYVNPEATRTARAVVESLASRLCPTVASRILSPRG